MFSSTTTTYTVLTLIDGTWVTLVTYLSLFNPIRSMCVTILAHELYFWPKVLMGTLSLIPQCDKRCLYQVPSFKL